MKYTISITKEEYDFIMQAVSQYVQNLQQKMTDQTQAWLIKTEGKKIIATTQEARWGYKKDGTPKKRPGRKVS